MHAVCLDRAMMLWHDGRQFRRDGLFSDRERLWVRKYVLFTGNEVWG